MKPACWRWAAVNVEARQPLWELSPVSLLYPITAASALAAFHQPVLVHRPVDWSYHRCSVPAPAAAQARKSGSVIACPAWPELYLGCSSHPRHLRLTGDLRRQQRAKLPAGLEIRPAGSPGDADRRPDLAPLQAGGDRLHGAHGTAGIGGAVHVQAVRPSPGGLQARVVDAIEEMLEGTRHVPDVGRGAEQVGVSLQHVDRGRGQGRADDNLDAFD